MDRFLNDNHMLMIPGPITVPPRILRANSRPMVNHRGPIFQKIHEYCVDGLKKIFKTDEGEVYIFASVGTGAMEACVSNFFNRDDRVLVLVNGNFGQRFVQIAKVYGLNVDVLEFVWGQYSDPEKVKDYLSKYPKGTYKGVLVQHNETSTAILNDLEKLSPIIKEHGALFVVDSISGMVAAPFEMDKWKVDVVAAASQKAFGCPPGISLLGVSKEALNRANNANLPRFYFDVRKYHESYKKGQPPFTAPISLYFSLEESLKMIFEEGLENFQKRHSVLRDSVRSAVRALGLKLVSDDNCASPVVTGVFVPEGINPQDIINTMRKDFGIVLAGGQSQFKGKIFRIGHLGFIGATEIFATFAALELTLDKLGYKFEKGISVKAAQKVFEESM
jgi:aspartate aminotransferase-like enzyme